MTGAAAHRPGRDLESPTAACASGRPRDPGPGPSSGRQNGPGQQRGFTTPEPPPDPDQQALHRHDCRPLASTLCDRCRHFLGLRKAERLAQGHSAEAGIRARPSGRSSQHPGPPRWLPGTRHSDPGARFPVSVAGQHARSSRPAGCRIPRAQLRSRCSGDRAPLSWTGPRGPRVWVREGGPGARVGQDAASDSGHRAGKAPPPF